MDRWRIARWAVVLATAALLAHPGPALAWSGRGHEQIADIAWENGLKSTTKSKLALIMAAGEPGFVPSSNWDSARRAAFRRVATFPDFIKSEASVRYGAIIPDMNSIWNPGGDPLVKSDQKVKCKTWHYYNTPLHYDGEIPAVPKSNAINALKRAIEKLAAIEATPSPDRERQCWWVYWIAHLTGDLHQPLHCAASYASGERDDGGNLFKIRDPQQPQNVISLHSYWDGGIEDAKKREQAMGLSSQVMDVSERWTSMAALQPSAAEKNNLDVASWVAEGSERAKGFVYQGIEEYEKPDGDYQSKQAALCKRRAVLGGYRLANVLNQILGQ